MSQRAHQLLILASSLLFGCLEPRVQVLDAAGAQTFILLIEDLRIEDPVKRLLKAEVRRELQPFTAPSEQIRVTLLAHSEPPETLGLSPGPLSLVRADVPRRALPRPQQTFGVLNGEWVPLPALPAELTALRIPNDTPCPGFSVKQIPLPGSFGHVRNLLRFGDRKLLAITSYFDCDRSEDPQCLLQKWRAFRVDENGATALPYWTDRPVAAATTAPGESCWIAPSATQDLVRYGRTSSGEADQVLERREVLLNLDGSPAPPGALGTLEDDSELWSVTSSGAVYRYRGAAPELIDRFAVSRGYEVTGVYPVEAGHAFVLFNTSVVEFRAGQAARPVTLDSKGATFQHLNVIPELGYVLSSESSAALGAGAFFVSEGESWNRVAVEGELATILLSNAPQQLIGFAGGFLAPADGGRALFLRPYELDSDGQILGPTLGLCGEIPLGAGNYYHGVIVDPGTIAVAGRQFMEVPDASSPASVYWITVR